MKILLALITLFGTFVTISGQNPAKDFFSKINYATFPTDTSQVLTDYVFFENLFGYKADFENISKKIPGAKKDFKFQKTIRKPVKNILTQARSIL